MPHLLHEALLRHAEARETIRAHEPWTVELNLAFCRPVGLSLRAKADWTAWRKLLAETEVPAGHIQDVRHTAATALFLLGVPQRVVMEILGWSQISILQRSQHVIDEMHQDVADKLTEHWAEPSRDPAPSNVISLQNRFRNRGDIGS